MMANPHVNDADVVVLLVGGMDGARCVGRLSQGRERGGGGTRHKDVAAMEHKCYSCVPVSSYSRPHTRVWHGVWLQAQQGP